MPGQDPADLWWSTHPVPPGPSPPKGSYLPVVVSGSLAIVSGQLPLEGGKLVAEGLVDREVPEDLARRAARAAALNGLAALRSALGGFAPVVRVLRVGVYVASSEGFSRQPAVANGASDLLAEVLGERGGHARVAVGTARLPMNSPVEVELWVAVKSGP
jgi:enamine deaminase RidA (YjgF/YER057c/UK114 family)